PQRARRTRDRVGARARAARRGESLSRPDLGAVGRGDRAAQDVRRGVAAEILMACAVRNLSSSLANAWISGLLSAPGPPLTAPAERSSSMRSRCARWSPMLFAVYN